MNVAFDLRLHPPSEEGGDWGVERRLAGTQILMPQRGVELLIKATECLDLDELIRFGTEVLKETDDLVRLLVQALVEADLITTPLDQNAVNQLDRWQRAGWEEAAEYHFMTLSYRFLRGTGSERAEATSRMFEYSAVEPDEDRFKSYYNSPKISLPHPFSAADTLDKYFASCDDKGDIDRVLDVFSLVFGCLGEINVPWLGKPLLHRSSPSGGARHPSEAYILSFTESLLPIGLYHVEIMTPALEFLNCDNFECVEWKKALTPAIQRCGFNPQFCVFITSAFRRNMYRYREPRTFRTPHMDAGHLIETLVCLVRKLGLQTYVSYGCDSVLVSRMLNVSPFEEGMMATVLLG